MVSVTGFKQVYLIDSGSIPIIWKWPDETRKMRMLGVYILTVSKADTDNNPNNNLCKFCFWKCCFTVGKHLLICNSLVCYYVIHNFDLKIFAAM